MIDKLLSDNIEILKGIAILGVLLIHSTAPYFSYLDINSLNYLLISLLNQISRFSIPMFVFLSGFLLLRKYKFSRLSEYKSFLIHKFIIIGVPYIYWSILYYLFFSIYNLYFSFSDMLVKLLTGTSIYTYYFFILIFQFYIISYFFMIALKKYKKWFVCINLIANSFVIYMFYFILFNFNVNIHPLFVFIFLSWNLFFVLGIYIADDYKRLFIKIKNHRGSIMLLTLSLLVLSLYEFYFINTQYLNINMAASNFKISSFSFAFFAILFCFAYVNNIPGFLRKSLIILGNSSFAIFILHEPFLTNLINLIHVTMPYLINYQILLQPILVAVSIIYSLSIFYVVKRLIPREYFKFIFHYYSRDK